MAAAEHNIIIEQGIDYIRDLTILDSVGVAADLSLGATTDFKCQIRRSENGPVAAEFTMSFVTDGTDGKIRLALTDAETNALDPDVTYLYDLFWTKPSGLVDRLLKGEVTIEERITRI